MAKAKPVQNKAALPEPTEGQRNAIATATLRNQSRPLRASMRISEVKDAALSLDAPHSDSAGAIRMMHDAFATTSDDFLNQVITQLANVTSQGAVSTQQTLNAGVALVSAIGPSDELEAALAVQMVASHELSLLMTQRARSAKTLETLREYGNLATKAARTFTAQIKALNDHRRGGEQVVRHLHVYEGGQAVVAETVNVGGPNAKAVEQSHALSPALLGFDPLGEGVPIARGEGQEAVPNARRHQSRRAKG